jgi:predicted nucleotidyltransferase
MGSLSKEENVLELFFNEPSKHWHFKDIIKAAKISRQQANKWLKRMLAEKIILRVKPNGKMPYFVANHEHSNYDSKKRIYALNKLYASGFMEYFQTLEGVKTVIIFGSYARGDWHTESDIDIFIYGDVDPLHVRTFYKGLGRELDVHTFKSLKDIKEIRTGLMNNVIEGFVVKGSVNDVILREKTRV